MRVALAQIDPVIGAFEQNVRKIKEAYRRACSKQARFLLTPELGVCGYPPHDLVERPEMFERNERALKDLIAATVGESCALLVGHVSPSPYAEGRAAQNVVSVVENGHIVHRQAKTLLPTYDVFDEARYFEPAREIAPWVCDGQRVALAICEDLWGSDPSFGRRLYGNDPVECYRREKVDLIVSISASPYMIDKRVRREELHAHAACSLKVPLIYVNQVGATDEILFDGASFAYDAHGKLSGRLPVFRNSFGLVDVAAGGLSWIEPKAEAREDEAPSEIEGLARGLVTGIRDYFARTGFKMAILGLSGGIDSTVVAVLAAEALGAENVLGVAMPSQFSSAHSLEDAEALARNLGIRYEVRPIKFQFATVARELAEGRGELAPLALENLQSRLRGNILMTLSNHYSALVLTTGNKSELATGYCTMYGDMCGAIAPLGDLLKTRVFELARFLANRTGTIPERCITKPPSAELRPDQKDEDSLPPYPLLDALLADYVEKNASVTELRAKFDRAPGAPSPTWVPETLRRLEINEYKRRQAAPVLKVSPKAFGIGRRVPIAKIWDQ